MQPFKVKFSYDPEVDAAYLRLRAGKIVSSKEVEPGIILDHSAEGVIVGVEILRFARRFKAKMTEAASRKPKRLAPQRV